MGSENDPRPGVSQTLEGRERCADPTVVPNAHGFEGHIEVGTHEDATATEPAFVQQIIERLDRHGQRALRLGGRERAMYRPSVMLSSTRLDFSFRAFEREASRPQALGGGEQR